MKSLYFALAVLVFGLITPGVAPAERAPVDQANWSSLKKEVRLPNGLRMAYVEVGDPDGEPLLLLHGYTDSSRSWTPLLPYLSRYRLLVPDQRGHGASDAPECCYGTSQFAFDARLFLDALAIKRAAIAGHSLGSMVAISLAADYPERVSKLVLIGSTALVPVKRGDWLFESGSAVKDKLDPASQFARDWHPANQPTPIDPAFANALNDDLYHIPGHVWRGVIRELTDVPAGRHSADVKAPVLVLSGGKDPLFNSEHHQSLLKAFPQAQGRVFPELGHNPNWEKPECIAAEMTAFLQ